MKTNIMSLAVIAGLSWFSMSSVVHAEQTEQPMRCSSSWVPFSNQIKITTVECTAIKEGIVLTDIKLNRGNCKDIFLVIYTGEMNKNNGIILKFGDTISFKTSCSLVEYTLTVDGVDWTWNVGP
jgi:hypothetical protein